MQIAVIESNPEQSKHLETARMKVAGLELDLVNLRSEKYADQTSRIPTMEFWDARAGCSQVLNSVSKTLHLLLCMCSCPGCMGGASA